MEINSTKRESAYADLVMLIGATRINVFDKSCDN